MLLDLTTPPDNYPSSGPTTPRFYEPDGRVDYLAERAILQLTPPAAVLTKQTQSSSSNNNNDRRQEVIRIELSEEEEEAAPAPAAAARPKARVSLSIAPAAALHTEFQQRGIAIQYALDTGLDGRIYTFTWTPVPAAVGDMPRIIEALDAVAVRKAIVIRVRVAAGNAWKAWRRALRAAKNKRAILKANGVFYIASDKTLFAFASWIGSGGDDDQPRDTTPPPGLEALLSAIRANAAAKERVILPTAGLGLADNGRGIHMELRERSLYLRGFSETMDGRQAASHLLHFFELLRLRHRILFFYFEDVSIDEVVDILPVTMFSRLVGHPEFFKPQF